MKLTKTIQTVALASLLALSPAEMMAAQKGGTFTTGDKTFLLNGKPFVVKAAELHYPRIPRAYWEHRIKMCKALGMNTVCLYVFWNIHEQKEGQFDFTGNNDVAAFCRLCQKNGMYVIVRPGPYVCAEWEMGGLPWWLLKKKDIRLREQDPYFMQRVEIFEKEVGKQLAPLTIQNGGPIIMVQVGHHFRCQRLIRDVLVIAARDQDDLLIEAAQTGNGAGRAHQSRGYPGEAPVRGQWPHAAAGRRRADAGSGRPAPKGPSAPAVLSPAVPAPRGWPFCLPDTPGVPLPAAPLPASHSVKPCTAGTG